MVFESTLKIENHIKHDILFFLNWQGPRNHRYPLKGYVDVLALTPAGTLLDI